MPTAMLEINAVAELSGISNTPMMPKLMIAVIAMGTVPIIPIQMLLNSMANKIATKTKDNNRLATWPCRSSSEKTKAL